MPRERIVHYMVNYRPRDLDRVFATLADPTRRAILARLAQEENLSVSALAEPFSIKLPAVMKHLDVLDDAGLITRTKHGRTVDVRLSPAPLRGASEWLRRYERFWSPALDRLAAHAERKEAEARAAEGKGRRR
jgi:DNA-binding transcriptional ArsR family regulator